MAAENWPAELPPCFVVGTYSFARGDGRLRDRPDAGPAMVRRRSSAVPGTLKGDLVFTMAQYDAFVAFGDATLVGWTAPFYFPSQTGGAPMLVRFGETLPPAVRLGANGMRVSMDLEVLP